MTLAAFAQALSKLGYPVAYSHFNSAVEPPFMVYLNPSDNSFGADNKVLHRTKNINVEVYTRKKDLALEQKLESFFNEKNLYFESDETWIDTEKVYVRTYYITL